MASFVLERSGQAKVSTVLRSNYSAVSSGGYDIDSVDHGRIKNWKPSRGWSIMPCIKSFLVGLITWYN